MQVSEPPPISAFGDIFSTQNISNDLKSFNPSQLFASHSKGQPKSKELPENSNFLQKEKKQKFTTPFCDNAKSPTSFRSVSADNSASGSAPFIDSRYNYSTSHDDCIKTPSYSSRYYDALPKYNIDSTLNNSKQDTNAERGFKLVPSYLNRSQYNSTPSYNNKNVNLSISQTTRDGEGSKMTSKRIAPVNPMKHVTSYNSDDDLFIDHRASVLQYEHINTPVPLVIPAGCHGTNQTRPSMLLRSVQEIPDRYRRVFPFPYFNIVQSKVFDDVMYTDKALVVCAPTGSGKTVIFELAILRLLTKSEHCMNLIKIVYMAPIKALCSERLSEWRDKFEPYGLKCKELTGDSEFDDYFQLQECNIVFTTPEKWDSMTRKWRDNRSLVQLVTLFLIDEIHVLNDDTRGATIEAVISRMKTVQPSLNSSSTIDLRFVAVSATIPNIDDIAAWLGRDDTVACHYKLDESYRPVRLRKVVLGFACSDVMSNFKFDMSLNYKLQNVIHTYSDHKPSLVFCSTRKGVQQTASVLVKDTSFPMSVDNKVKLKDCSLRIKDSKLRDLILRGVGYHHAGMDLQDRKLMENIFAGGQLPVLVATSTLCMGVNLPAHLVVIKSTTYYVMGCHQEYSDTQVLQMIGRAGRPQFDSSATAVIMTKASTKLKYEALVAGTQDIESNLHKHLIEHLNAEIVLSTIVDVSVAMEWLRSTFLYIRVMKNPQHYGVPAGLNKDQVEQRLQDLCMKNLHLLAGVDLIKMDENVFNVHTTEKGRLMARYCIAFDTMKSFSTVTGQESLSEMLSMISNCHEFSDITLRVTDKKALNTLNKDKNRATIRFPLSGKIKTKQMKVNCLIQTQLGCLILHDFALTTDIGKIFRSGQRLTRGLFEFMWLKDDFRSLLHACLLYKCFKAKLWEDSVFVTRQLDGIGPAMSNAFVNAGITTFQKIEETNPRDLELIVNRHAPFGNQIRDAAAKFPKLQLSIEQVARYGCNVAELVLTVNVTNGDCLTAGHNYNYQMCTVIIGDADNVVVFKAKIMLRTLVAEWSRKIEVKRARRGEHLDVNLISLDYVGVDVQSSYSPFYIGPKTMTVSGSNSTQQTSKQSDSAAKSCNGKKSRTNKSPEEGVDVEVIEILDSDNPPCQHKCHNKSQCRHICCKTGVANKRSLPKLARYTDHLDNIKRKLCDFPATPNLSRIRPPQSTYFMRPDINKFAYTPKLPLKFSARNSAPPTNQYQAQSNHTLPANIYGHPSSVRRITEAGKERGYEDLHERMSTDDGTDSVELPDLDSDASTWAQPTLSHVNNEGNDYGNFNLYDDPEFSDDDVMVVEDFQSTNKPHHPHTNTVAPQIKRGSITAKNKEPKPCTMTSQMCVNVVMNEGSGDLNRRTSLNPYMSAFTDNIAPSNTKHTFCDGALTAGYNYGNVGPNTNQPIHAEQLGAVKHGNVFAWQLKQDNVNRPKITPSHSVRQNVLVNSFNDGNVGVCQSMNKSLIGDANRAQNVNSGSGVERRNVLHASTAVTPFTPVSHGGHASEMGQLNAGERAYNTLHNSQASDFSPTIPQVSDFAMASSLLRPHPPSVPCNKEQVTPTIIERGDHHQKESPQFSSDDEFMTDFIQSQNTSQTTDVIVPTRKILATLNEMEKPDSLMKMFSKNSPSKTEIDTFGSIFDGIF